jgi:hypothetical protein
MKTFEDKPTILNRVKTAYNITSEQQLASFLGINKSTLSNWKRRNSIDFELLFSKCENISYHWLLTGEGQMLLTEGQKQTSLEDAVLLAENIKLKEKIAELEEKVGELKEDKRNQQQLITLLQTENKKVKVSDRK